MLRSKSKKITTNYIVFLDYEHGAIEKVKNVNQRNSSMQIGGTSAVLLRR